MRVFIVDDDPVTTSTVAVLVGELGHEVHVFHSASEAWVAHQDTPASVIFSDWQMPEMNGLGLLKKVRDHSERYTYFVLFTGVYTAADDYLAGIRAGADTFIKKPLSREAVHGRLLAAGRLLDRMRSEDRAREILRFCCFCKDVCPEPDDWQTLESFVNNRLGIRLSHGVCPKCLPMWLDSFNQPIGVSPESR